jgi:hypothetical protein
MDERLAELKRQRAGIAAHLAWLDREIAACEGVRPASGATGPATGPTIPFPPPSTAAATAMQAPAAPLPLQGSAADATSSLPLSGVPEIDPRSIKSDVQRGCLVYIALGLVVAALFVFWVYWHYSD